MARDKNTGKKKKKGGKTKMAAGACVAAVLLLSGLGLDIGGFGSGIGFPTFAPDNQNTNNPNAEDVFVETPLDEDSEQATPPVGEGQEELPLSLLIRVSGDSIIHNDQPLSIDELRVLLTEANQPDHIWELQDDQAIMAMYNEVRMLLIEKGVRYEETIS